MTEGMFTEADAQDDSVFKAGLQESIGQAAARNFPELYDYFQQVCEEETGAPPYAVLADAVIRALNNDSFAERVAEEEIDISRVKIGENREEDLEYALDLYEKIEEFEDNGVDLDINELVEQKLGMSQDPFAGFTSEMGEEKQDKLAEAINSLNNRVKELEQSMQDDGNAVEVTEVESDNEDVEGNVDNLFDDEEEEEETENGDPITEDDGGEEDE